MTKKTGHLNWLLLAYTIHTQRQCGQYGQYMPINNSRWMPTTQLHWQSCGQKQLLLLLLLALLWIVSVQLYNYTIMIMVTSSISIVQYSSSIPPPLILNTTSPCCLAVNSQVPMYMYGRPEAACVFDNHDCYYFNYYY